MSEAMFASKDEILEVARQRWLKNREVLHILSCAGQLSLHSSPEVVQRPASGQLVLYDRGAVRHFRRDAHGWKKKRDGKTLREDHEKLKIDGVERITC
eukprot:CAMPEP_0172170210 /NCGR_PEP_ID=MMETSP1050-20130122/11136_1 /TAXON_ID=233186 /ORGANISM="Cryptomonas curvata, Strain CCAP979/52" /LENGTH=97 /DNA_ID=CAMNT_0012841357 /DNA_START=78 /DNA_END=368 /DNA_ORIENTATION=-